MDTATTHGRRRVLVLFAHPALQRSRVNRVLIRGLERIEGVTFHDLYEAYPDLNIDVAREQELLDAHDVVVMHFPFFWYSTPAILKEWQDLVLEHGWAYGSEGNHLRGKVLLTVVTSGGKQEAYTPEGYNRHTVRTLLAPLEQTAHLCGMIWYAPYVAHGSLGMSSSDIEERAREYHQLLEALRDGRVDEQYATARDTAFLNADLGRTLQRGGADV